MLTYLRFEVKLLDTCLDVADLLIQAEKLRLTNTSNYVNHKVKK